MMPPEAPAAGLVPRLLAAGNSGAIALLQQGREPVSFGGLRARVERYASELRALGFGRRDLIAVSLPDTSELLIAFLGIANVCAAAPLACTLAEAEYHSLLTRLEVRAVLTRAGEESRVRAAAQSLGIPIIEWNGEASEMRLVWNSAAAKPSCPKPRQIRARQIRKGVVLVLETSATTGCPKLVPFTSENLFAIAGNMQQALRFSAHDRYLTIMPLTHLLGLVSGLAQLLRGGSVACVDGFAADRFAACLHEFRPTWYSAGPTVHRAVIELARSGQTAFQAASLRFIRSGSAALAPALADALERVLHVPVMDGYGLTEAGQVTSNRPAARKPGSAGTCLGTSVGIMDNSGELLPAGREGEVVLRGPAVMHGYLDDPEGNRETFKNGWLRTGDLGRLDAGGDLFITGRIKEAINRGGETIAPQQIDHALEDHPAVAEAVAFGFGHPTLGEGVAAAVVLHAGATASGPELRQFLASRLSPSRLPDRIVFLHRIPAGQYGKRHRALLADQFREWPGPSAADAPSDELQQRIAAVWMRILKTALPGPTDNFFALGGDSLSAAIMLKAVQSELGADKRMLQRVDFFECPTLERLAAIVRECDAASGEKPFTGGPEIVLQGRGKGVPFFCFPGVSQDVYYFRHLARYFDNERPFIAFGHPMEDGRAKPTIGDLAKQFVARIRRLRPTGPYMLGGHCYGGILAFEIALRLRALSESVPLLALFDTPTPGYPKPMRHWKQYARQIARLMSGVGREGNRVADIAAHMRFLARIMGSQAASRPEPVPGIEAQAVTPAHQIQEYVPRPYAGKIVHFIAGQAAVSSRVLEDARLGWRDFAAGGIEVQQVPGSHDSMFLEEHAQDLAARLRVVFRNV